MKMSIPRRRGGACREKEVTRKGGEPAVREQKRRKETKVHGVTENTQKERKVVPEDQDVKALGLRDACAPLPDL